MSLVSTLHHGLHVWWQRGLPATAAVLVLAVGAMKVKRYIARSNRRKRWAKTSKDLVIVHGLHKGVLTPNMSPFVLKLETYLRLASIPYQMDYEEPFGPKGQAPWITLNGEEIGDSQLVIETLGQRYGKDFTSHLTAEQQGAARAISMMVTEHLAWCFRNWRWVEDGGRSVMKQMGIPFFRRQLMKIYARTVKKTVFIHGVGRHTYEEIHRIAEKDLAALSVYLGEKPFMMGDEPSEVDCTVFGALAQIMWNYSGSPYERMLKVQFPNLRDYVLRVKERLWPDWEKCLRRPKTD